MILDLAKISALIPSWIRDITHDYGFKSLTLHLTPSTNSFLTAILCKKSGIPLTCLSTQPSIVTPLTQKFDIPLISVNINTEKSYNIVPTLCQHADNTKALIVGSLCRNEFKLVRSYHKFGDGSIDIAPIADLFFSEAKQLYAFLNLDSLEDELNIYNLTAKEIEWADKENEKNGIIYAVTDPAKYKLWYQYSSRQKEIIAQIHQLEKASKIKINDNLSVCKLRHLTNIIK